MFKRWGKLRRVKRSMFWRLFQYFLVLILFFVASFQWGYRHFVGLYEDEISATYASSLVSLGGSIDTLFRELHNNTYLLSDHRSLVEVLYEKDFIGPEKYDLVIQVKEVLGHFMTTKEMITSIAIVLKDSRLVVSGNGSVEYGNYFGHMNVYDDFPIEYWNTYSTNGAKFRILPPTGVTNRQTSQYQRVIPIVMQEIGRYYTSNLFILNLNNQYFSRTLNEHKLTPGSRLYVLDRNGGMYMSSDNGALPPELESPDFTSKLQTGVKQDFPYTLSGQKMRVLTQPSNNLFLDGFSYVACVPYSDMAAKLAPLKSFMYGAGALFLLLSVLIAYFMSRNLYRPIKGLMHNLQPDRRTPLTPGVPRDELDYINTHIGYILEDNAALSQDLNAFAPLLQEKHLLKLLNSEHYVPEHELRRFWGKSEVEFPHPAFIVLAVSVKLTDAFYRRYDEWERSGIYQGIKKLFLQVFPQGWRVYILAPEKNLLSLILNLPEDAAEEVVQRCLLQVFDLFAQDREFVSYAVGIGGKHREYAGIQHSYKESLKALAAVSPYAHNAISHYREGIKADFTYSLPVEEENRLFHYLMGGQEEETSQLLHTTIERNIARQVPDEQLHHLYLRLYHVGLKAVEAKSLSLEELAEEGGLPFHGAAGVQKLSPQELGDYVVKLYAAICQAEPIRTRMDVQEIIRYIDGHYAEDIYLEQLADMYGTSGKYLSRLLKNALGMPFQHYLANLRIARARELLAHTDVPVLEVGLAAGFNTKTTFLRMFKKLEGVTPSEYRSRFRASGK